jgi:hypothetical protein
MVGPFLASLVAHEWLMCIMYKAVYDNAPYLIGTPTLDNLNLYLLTSHCDGNVEAYSRHNAHRELAPDGAHPLS